MHIADHGVEASSTRLPARDVGPRIDTQPLAQLERWASLWFLYFTLYWPHRDRFDEAGRYLDEATMVVCQQQSGLLVIPAMALSFLALVLAYFWRAARRLHHADRGLQS